MTTLQKDIIVAAPASVAETGIYEMEIMRLRAEAEIQKEILKNSK
ncbi:MAG TPA: hypothetical protein VGJ73_23205 [Verrucomicrobiae bacterium]|jgi:hypothetical protein